MQMRGSKKHSEVQMKRVTYTTHDHGNGPYGEFQFYSRHLKLTRNAPMFILGTIEEMRALVRSMNLMVEEAEAAIAAGGTSHRQWEVE